MMETNNNKPHLYLEEWIRYRGMNQAQVRDKTNIDKAQLSRMASNAFKKAPHPATIKKLADVLDIRVEDLWHNPYDLTSSRDLHRQLVDINEWLADPRATVDGILANQHLKTGVKNLIDFFHGKIKPPKPPDINQWLGDPNATVNGETVEQDVKELIKGVIAFRKNRKLMRNE